MRVLLLAGTREARHIAAGLSQIPRLNAVASLPRAELRPSPLGLPTRIGGFGGAEGFADWLRRERITAILDASHPFATQITARSQAMARELGIDYIRFMRPAWLPDAEDSWTFLNDASEAPQHIPTGSRVFVSTDAQGLAHLTGFDHHIMHVRLDGAAAPHFPFKAGFYVSGIPPFSTSSEADLLRALETDWIVARNSGGTESRTKLDAARLLGIRVAMIRRPPQPPGPKVDTVAEVLAWVRRRM